ncbi:aminotransferase class V-fold PLP-dependent enzyme [archaeon]|jgi:cysteine desulfurase / selenocysteine lyase|nr:aminotransferase class V-fold PLP-dependent enzyme [archaeon]MBT4397581.1 aminotransferase class V-fold PLP-dependent enzyme [archaeon]MBT4440836.1 aminotransferase class V-fold PLP-dependent enzyme [archaeon]
MLDTRSIRQHFPYLQGDLALNVQREFPRDRTFLDNTASTQLPLPVFERIAESLFEYANIHRGEYDASRRTTEDFERAYNTAANLVNADSWREIMFGRNATEMVNLIMRGIAEQIRDGDNIVSTQLEHNSNYVPWFGLQQMLKKRGINIEIRLAGFDRETGELDQGELESLIDGKTKLVSVTGASNFLGYKPNVPRIGEVAHSSGYEHTDGRKGSYFLVDGAQLVPGSPVDVKKMGADFLAWSFHKMSLPLGVGGLFARKEVIETFDPFLYGGDMIYDVQEGAVEYQELPWKFTAGTPNVIGTLATGFGTSFLMHLGLGNLGSEEARAKFIETQAFMNTPRGDFELPFAVSERDREVWIPYLRSNPGKMAIFKDPALRLAETRRIIDVAMGNIETHEQELTQSMIEALSGIPNVTIYGPKDATKRTGLVAFNVNGVDPQNVAFELNRLGVESRNGNHCASLAHNYLGIEGSVRFSFYVYNDQSDLDKAVDAVREVARRVA